MARKQQSKKAATAPTCTPACGDVTEEGAPGTISAPALLASFLKETSGDFAMREQSALATCARIQPVSLRKATHHQAPVAMLGTESLF
jgi:hypothetical protein